MPSQMEDDERGSKPGVAPCRSMTSIREARTPTFNYQLPTSVVLRGAGLQIKEFATSTLGSPPLSALCHSLACSLTPSRLFFFFGSLFLDRFSLLRSNLFYDYYLICEMPLSFSTRNWQQNLNGGYPEMLLLSDIYQRPYFTLSHTERERPYSTNRKARTGITSPRGKSTRVREEKTRLYFSEELDSWRLFWWSQIEIA